MPILFPDPIVTTRPAAKPKERSYTFREILFEPKVMYGYESAKSISGAINAIKSWAADTPPPHPPPTPVIVEPTAIRFYLPMD